MQKLIEELKAKLMRTTQETLSAEEKNAMMEAAMSAEEKLAESLKNEVTQTSALKMRRADELHNIKLRKRHMDTDIQVDNIAHLYKEQHT